MEGLLSHHWEEKKGRLPGGGNIFLLDQVKQVEICSEGQWKDGILVTEEQMELVRHLVWLDRV